MSLGAAAVLARIKVTRGADWLIEGDSRTPLCAVRREDRSVCVWASSPAELETRLIAWESARSYGDRPTRHGPRAGAAK